MLASYNHASSSTPFIFKGTISCPGILIDIEHGLSPHFFTDIKDYIIPPILCN